MKKTKITFNNFTEMHLRFSNRGKIQVPGCCYAVKDWENVSKNWTNLEKKFEKVKLFVVNIKTAFDNIQAMRWQLREIVSTT